MKTYVLILAAGLSAYAIGRVHGYHDGYDDRGAEVRLAQALQERAELEALQIRTVLDLSNAGALEGYTTAPVVHVGRCTGAP